MSDHYGPFEKYTEVMISGGGVFGLRAGEEMDVLEGGGVDIYVAQPEAVEEVEPEAAGNVVGETVEAEPDSEPTADPEQLSEGTDPESPELSPEAIAFAEAQQTPNE